MSKHVSFSGFYLLTKDEISPKSREFMLLSVFIRDISLVLVLSWQYSHIILFVFVHFVNKVMLLCFLG